MTENNKTILFVREVPWESVFPISTRMIAEQFLLHGWKIIWFTMPLMPWHRNPRGPYRAQIFKQHRERGIFHEDKRVFSYTPRAYIPFSKHFPLDRPILADHMWRFCLPSIKAILRESGMPRPDLLWLSSPPSHGISRLFPDLPAVQHVTDYYQGYASSPATCGVIEKSNYERADIVVVTAPTLKPALHEEFGIDEEKIFFISQGVKLEHYKKDDVPDPVPKAPHPRLIMLGNLAKLHFETVEYICRNLKDGCLMALGPGNPTLSALAEKYPNLWLEGPIKPENVPGYLMHGDVGLVLFDEGMARVVQHVNPMKLYEYAAAGLPAVSTPMPVYSYLDCPVLVSETPAGIFAHVNEALANRDHYRQAMLDFASSNTWKDRYDEIAEIFSKLGLPCANFADGVRE